MSEIERFHSYPHMDERLEFLRMENKKLRGRHNELESNLTEEKEMVKYLHGVIKNYQQLLKTPDSTRHLKASSLKKTSHSVSARRLAGESDAEECFVKKLVEMSGDRSSINDGCTKKDSQISALTEKNDKHTALRYASNCENADRINTNWQNRLDDSLASRKDSEVDMQAELTSDTHKKFLDMKDSDSGRGSLDVPSVSDAEKVAETVSKHSRENVLNDMAQMLDSMMAKAIIYEDGLKQKDKHLKRMERRYEYLASLALGEESEWL